MLNKDREIDKNVQGQALQDFLKIFLLLRKRVFLKNSLHIFINLTESMLNTEKCQIVKILLKGV